MNTKSLIEQFAGFLGECYDAVEEMGGSRPSQPNLANLTDAIDSIPSAPPYDPSNPTLSGLKAALDAGNYSAFPAGTEIPDEYDGQSNPLIVAQYLDSSNNSAYGGAEGVILVRKYVEPVSQVFGSNSDYRSSAIKTFLDNEYFNKCSLSLQNLCSEITVQYFYNLSKENITSKWFLMSTYEVYSKPESISSEGIQWQYWKDKTGLSSPSSASNAGRVITDINNTVRSWWLRSRSDTLVEYINTSGYNTTTYSSNSDCGVLPACFIAKGNN